MDGILDLGCWGKWRWMRFFGYLGTGTKETKSYMRSALKWCNRIVVHMWWCQRANLKVKANISYVRRGIPSLLFLLYAWINPIVSHPWLKPGSFIFVFLTFLASAPRLIHLASSAPTCLHYLRTGALWVIVGWRPGLGCTINFMGVITMVLLLTLSASSIPILNYYPVSLINNKTW